MNKNLRISAKNYYNMLPELRHQCGDIWKGLPSFGIIGIDTCTGIVITPACDLSWQKSDTVTYLPIVPVRALFSMDVSLSPILEKIAAAIKVTELDDCPAWTAAHYLTPPQEEIDKLLARTKAYTSERQRSAKVLAAADRIGAALGILQIIAAPTLQSVAVESLVKVFGGEWQKIKERIITNSYSPGLHFLPSDEQDEVFSGVFEHSVVLFRYPITVPVKMLNHAQETFETEWQQRLKEVDTHPTLQHAFSTKRPVKLLSLRSAFLSDLLTRFSSLYNRIGSPDFTVETVGKYAKQVDS